MEERVDEVDPSQMEYALKRSLLSRNKLAIILKTATGETEYCCVECSIKYTDKEKLELHLCTHNKLYRFLCGICGTGLKRKEHLDRHMLEHTEVRPYKCLDCGKAFKRKEHLNIHQSIHTGQKSQVCTLCDRSFNRKDHLQKHLQTHSKLFLEQNMYPVDDQELIDTKGQPEFIDINDSEEFMDIKEEVADGNYMEYETGSDSYDNGEYIKDEYSTTTEPNVDVRTPDSHTNSRPYVCTVCYKSYKRKDHLKIHSWTHMKKDKTCSGCGKAFHKDIQLAAHMHTCMQVHVRQRVEQEDETPHDLEEFHHLDAMVADNMLLVERKRRVDPESRPHQCVICHRRFKRKQHLKVHANVHLKQEASIWCSLCNEGFVSNTQFEQHQCNSAIKQEGEDLAYDDGEEQVHKPNAPEAKKENKYPEDLLVQEMVESTTEETTYLTVQDEQNIPVPQRVFVCRFCQKPFKRRDHYKIHLHIHTGVKDFFCPDCGKGFYRKDHLQKHSQTHSKQKPKPKKQLPDLFPISMMPKKAATDIKEIKPEITITAPSSSKLRVPLQIKVPYQMVVAGDDGERRTLTVAPQHPARHELRA